MSARCHWSLWEGVWLFVMEVTSLTLAWSGMMSAGLTWWLRNHTCIQAPSPAEHHTTKCVHLAPYTGFTCVTVKLLHIHTYWNKRWWFYVIPCLSVVMWMNEERCFLPFGNPPASAPRFRLQVSGPGRSLWIPPLWWSLFHSYTLKGQTVTQPSRHFKNMLMTNISK